MKKTTKRNFFSLWITAIGFDFFWTCRSREGGFPAIGVESFKLNWHKKGRAILLMALLSILFIGGCSLWGDSNTSETQGSADNATDEDETSVDAPFINKCNQAYDDYITCLDKPDPSQCDTEHRADMVEALQLLTDPQKKATKERELSDRRDNQTVIAALTIAPSCLHLQTDKEKNICNIKLFVNSGKEQICKK